MNETEPTKDELFDILVAAYRSVMFVNGPPDLDWLDEFEGIVRQYGNVGDHIIGCVCTECLSAIARQLRGNE